MGKRTKPSSNEEIEQNWEFIWKDILELPDGSIDKAQLKKELMDYSDMIRRMTSLTCKVTHERLSYPTYPVETIMGVMEEIQEEDRENQLKDDKECGVCSMCGHEFEEDNSENIS